MRAPLGVPSGLPASRSTDHLAPHVIHTDLVDTFGEDRAREYGEANGAGLATVRRLGAERAIDCELGQAAQAVADCKKQ
jgi:hypothetical protein